MIDGLHVDDHVVLVALGFDEAGAKHLLGIHEGATENRESCTALMTNLVERGIDSTRSTLFVLDGAKALRRAVLDVFGKRALIQRCQLHKQRNILEHLPEEKRPGVETILKEAFRAATSKTAKSRLKALAGRLAADSIRQKRSFMVCRSHSPSGSDWRSDRGPRRSRVSPRWHNWRTTPP